MPSSLLASKAGGHRVHSSGPRRIRLRHALTRPSVVDVVDVPRDRRRRDRRRTRCNRRPGSWRRGGSNGNGIPGVRGVRRQPPSSPGFTREKSRTHRADKGLHRKTSAGIHNRLLEELNQEGTAILPYPLQRGLVRNLAIPAEAAGRSDLLPLWAGKAPIFRLARTCQLS